MSSTALIIGGTTGLGQELANRCKDAGMDTIITGRSLPKQGDQVDGHFGIGLDLLQNDSISDAAMLVTKKMTYQSSTINTPYVFCVAGAGLQGDFVNQHFDDIDHMFGVNVTGMMKFLQVLLKGGLGRTTIPDRTALHLVTISSSSSGTIRSNESLYGPAKAAQAMFARDLHAELQRTLGDVKFTLVHPGGMKTPFWDKTAVNTALYMDPEEVGGIIMNNVLSQRGSWSEFQVRRNDVGKAIFIPGAPLPS